MSTPQVAILVGAKADLATMDEASAVLEELGIPHTVDVMSVHHHPDEVRAFVRAAKDAGYLVLIAGDGDAPHLPAVVAAHTTLPVIGVPLASNHLRGTDALRTIIQMPAGVPVATVGVDGARNAGILAAQVVATASPQVAQAIVDLRAEQADRGVEHRDVPAEGRAGLGFGFQPG